MFRGPSSRRAPRAAVVPPAVAEALAAEPLLAVDVGAARGVCPHWQPYLDHLRVEAFEPDVAECTRLAAHSHPNIQWHPTALAGTAGPRELHVLATPTGSSFFPLEPAFVALFGVPEYHREVEVATLDCVSLGDHLAASGRAGPHLVKLDTQGSELEILGGLSSDQFDEVLAVEVESELHPAYRGQPLFPELHGFLEGQGLHLLDIRVQRVHLTGGIEENHYLRRRLRRAVGTPDLTAQAHAVDALYVRPLPEQAQVSDIAGLARLLTVLQIYRYFDGVFWLLDQPGIRSMLGADLADSLIAVYQDAAPGPSPLHRAGRLPRLVRRGRRAASYGWEALGGADGFDPPRRAWTHLYWPDS